MIILLLLRLLRVLRNKGVKSISNITEGKKRQRNTQPPSFVYKRNKRNNVTKAERYNILKKQKWCCAMCGVSLKFDKNSKFGIETSHIDHIHPVSKSSSYNGYIHELKNLQGLCERCNLIKSDKLAKCPICGTRLRIEYLYWSDGWKKYVSDNVWETIKDEREIVFVCPSHYGCGKIWDMDDVVWIKKSDMK